MNVLQNEKEIVALLQLIDDPDQEVFDLVTQKLLTYGTGIIPKLEQLLNFSETSLMEGRINFLIHQINYFQLQTDLIKWSQKEFPSILDAGILIAKYQYPEMDKENVLHQFELMRKNIWLELNNFLSPLEQINIINSILFNFFRLQGHELNELNPDHFYINKTIESKHGNAFTIGILYLSLCELLDVPIFAIDLPNQFVLAYFEHSFSFLDTEEKKLIPQVQFFIDPINGIVYNKKDIENYLTQNERPELFNSLKALDSRDFIALMLERLALTYSEKGDYDNASDLQNLILLLQKQ
ncbi:MAG TPA: transglutaminase family protein [Edaphocola sp.]|nr:transglutaminase family protein [Edaphocola sp.]